MATGDRSTVRRALSTRQSELRNSVPPTVAARCSSSAAFCQLLRAAAHAGKGIPADRLRPYDGYRFVLFLKPTNCFQEALDCAFGRIGNETSTTASQSLLAGSLMSLPPVKPVRRRKTPLKIGQLRTLLLSRPGDLFLIRDCRLKRLPSANDDEPKSHP